jgi:hypothetical protein
MACTIWFGEAPNSAENRGKRWLSYAEPALELPPNTTKIAAADFFS